MAFQRTARTWPFRNQAILLGLASEPYMAPRLLGIADMTLKYNNSRWSLYHADGTLHAYTEDSDVAFNIQVALAKMELIRKVQP